MFAEDEPKSAFSAPRSERLKITAMWFSDSRVNHLHSCCDSLTLDFSQPQHHFLQCERRTSPLTLPSRLRPSWAFPPRTWAVLCTALFFCPHGTLALSGCSESCMRTLSTQRSNLKPTRRKVPI